eukprot:CAMPEP_0114618862 /NCGR_PEP_ID=MMETSP0168-20121206/7917_1 /TAXON_ID=95228 ORGANISM="Vannella sp., Strain DIVA3 517/6/12" /NCGR_SAMPLE_ID=MMETSP0168 /ASSEMBLY_ACC=CAM_ASM_000044 /LENGTH=489 /DNA_ID=CAMNT_0001830013 /DNA_START=43 /DNA_END=1509 /DNA_ORIENTATION=+
MADREEGGGSWRWARQLLSSRPLRYLRPGLDEMASCCASERTIRALGVAELQCRALCAVARDPSLSALLRTTVLLQEEATAVFSNGVGDERELVENRDRLFEVQQGLDEEQQLCIGPYVRMAGAELAEFVSREIDSIEDWNSYCHCTGGLLLLVQCRLLALGLPCQTLSQSREGYNGGGGRERGREKERGEKERAGHNEGESERECGEVGDSSARERGSDSEEEQNEESETERERGKRGRERQLRFLASAYGQELLHETALLLAKAEAVASFHDDMGGGTLRWPKEILSAYVGRAEELSGSSLGGRTLDCWNAMCADALSHSLSALELLEQLASDCDSGDDLSERESEGENGRDSGRDSERQRESEGERGREEDGKAPANGLLAFFAVPIAGALHVLANSYNSPSAAAFPVPWTDANRRLLRELVIRKGVTAVEDSLYESAQLLSSRSPDERVAAVARRLLERCEPLHQGGGLAQTLLWPVALAAAASA